MKISLTESQVKNLVKVLSEAFEAVPFELYIDEPEYTDYRFSLNGFDYLVVIEMDAPNNYFLTFDILRDDDHITDTDNSGLDLKHLNTVVYTVYKITEDFINNHPDTEVMRINPTYDSSRGESTDGDDNIRMRIYARFIKNTNLNITGYHIDEVNNVIVLLFK